MPVNENTPLVSLCCISYNQERFVEDSIISIFDQTWKNIEIIVIDDGSKDGTYSRLVDLQKRSPFPMQVFTQANTAIIGLNINRSLMKAKGKYVRILALDDILTPDSTRLFVEKMESDPDLHFICCDRRPTIDEFGNLTGEVRKDPIYEKKATDLTIKDLLQMEFDTWGTFYIQNAIFKRSTLVSSGGCDEELIGDDFTLRIRLLQYMLNNGMTGYSIFNHESFLYRRHQHNLSKNEKRNLLILMECSKKHVCRKTLQGFPANMAPGDERQNRSDQ